MSFDRRMFLPQKIETEEKGNESYIQKKRMLMRNIHWKGEPSRTVVKTMGIALLFYGESLVPFCERNCVPLQNFFTI